jgi:NAD(P)-dependent dehydrogenase (short-subunit alcohol dehydrogenase family)
MHRVVVVTGASSGVGHATARAFAGAGDHVVATSRSLPQFGPLDDHGGDGGIESMVLDVTDAMAVGALADDVLARHGRVDVVVCNAGVGLVGTTEALSEEDFRASLDVNFFGVVHVTKAFLPAMRVARTGRLIAVTSIGGVVGQPFNDAYCAAKFAVEGTYESLHPVAASFGVHVSIVEPGPVRTGFSARARRAGTAVADIEVLAQRQARALDAGRDLGQEPEEVATVILATADDPSPVLRYQSSRFVAKFVGRKLADLDGSAITAITGAWLRPPVE